MPDDELLKILKICSIICTNVTSNMFRFAHWKNQCTWEHLFIFLNIMLSFWLICSFHLHSFFATPLSSSCTSHFKSLNPLCILNTNILYKFKMFHILCRHICKHIFWWELIFNSQMLISHSLSHTHRQFVYSTNLYSVYAHLGLKFGLRYECQQLYNSSCRGSKKPILQSLPMVSIWDDFFWTPLSKT